MILTGCTDSVNKKCIAEQVAKRIAGVRGVVNDIIENLIEVTGTQTVDGFDLAGQGDKMTR